MTEWAGHERRISTERTLGEHSATLRTLSDDISAIKSDVKTLLERENQREGGKKTIYALSTVLGSIGGILASKYFK